MKIYSSVNHSSRSDCVVALGCFDGVHIGHAKVISTAREIADHLGCACAVWTFDEPPRNYFIKNGVPLITDQKEKEELIRSLGVDKLISVPFTRETARISAEDFFENILVNRLRAVHIVCGFNYTFGAQGLGNEKMLEKLCKEKGIGFTIVPAVSISGVTASSSAIRDALTEGDTELAMSLLGRPHSIRTVVISGQRLGRRLGFPTLNQEFPTGRLVPKKGVYASRITVDESKKTYFGITNVGIRPTVGGTSLFAETNIFDFSGDLYGRKVKVEFLKFLRDERKFPTLTLLTEQIEKDVQTAKEYLKIFNEEA